MNPETVSENEEVVQEQEVVEQAETNDLSEPQEGAEKQNEEMVPLWTLQKERAKRQEAELEARWYRERERSVKEPSQEEEDLDETVTKKDLKKIRNETEQAVYEKIWVRENPERAVYVDENIENFLKQRPNLKEAIKSAPNRYEEAWELMDKLSPKQKVALKSTSSKKDAPGSPSAIPKAASMGQAIDVMSMGDKEFNEWRKTQRSRR